jgi:hypothetical protein
LTDGYQFLSADCPESICLRTGLCPSTFSSRFFQHIAPIGFQDCHHTASHTSITTTADSGCSSGVDSLDQTSGLIGADEKARSVCMSPLSVIKNMTIQKIIQILLESDLPLSAQGLIEASVHLPKRGTIFMAAFRDEHGHQVQQTTHQRDRAAAQAVADELEAVAKQRRLAMSMAKPGKPRIRVRRGSAERLLGLLSHAEIAALMGLSERTIRKIEADALRKLFSHPELRAFWREHMTGGVDESDFEGQLPWILAQSAIGALFTLTTTSLERRALTKLLVVTGNILL